MTTQQIAVKVGKEEANKTFHFLSLEMRNHRISIAEFQKRWDETAQAAGLIKAPSMA